MVRRAHGIWVFVTLVALLAAACGGSDSAKRAVEAKRSGQPAAATGEAAGSEPAAAPETAAPEVTPDTGAAAAEAPSAPVSGGLSASAGGSATPKAQGSKAPSPAAKGSTAAAPRGGPSAASAGPAASGAQAPGSAAPTPGAAPNPAQPGGGGATDVGVTEAAIKVGHIGILSGPVAGVGDDISWAGQAVLKWYNDNGGINGRKLDVKVRDDQWDGTKGMNAARDLAEREKVFGFCCIQTVPTNDLMGPYVSKLGIPNVGGDGWGEAQYGHEWQWPTGQSSTVDGYVLAEYAAKKQGAKTASIFYYDSPQGRSYVKGFTQQFQKFGGKVVFAQAGTFDDPATSTYVARSRAENVDVSTFWGEPGLWVKMIREAASQAYRPKLGFQGCACLYFDEIPDLAGPWAEGTVATTGFTPHDQGLAQKSPGFMEYVQITEKYFPKIHHSNWTKAGYMGGRLFGDTLKKLGLNVTRKGLKDALDQVQDIDLGLGAKLSFWKPSRRANHTTYLLKLGKGASGGMSFKYLDGPFQDPVNTPEKADPLTG